MQILFVCVAMLMAVAALILLVIAAMSTGSTRKELYRYISHASFNVFLLFIDFITTYSHTLRNGECPYIAQILGILLVNFINVKAVNENIS